MDTYELLKKVTDTAGPSGYEQDIAAVIRELWQPFTDRQEIDVVGNLIAVKQGEGKEPRRSILLAAHMDEIALMVTRIDSHQGNGFLRTTRIGGVDNRHLYGQLVVVHGRRDVNGVIGCLPSSMLPEERRTKPFGFEDLRIDVGLPIEEVRELVSVGDFISFRQPLRKLLGNRVAGKSLDNRASVAAVTLCLEYLSGRIHSWDVVAVATSQEETRLLGAYTSAYTQRPDVAIAIDVGHGKGPSATDAGTFELGSGPVLELGPNVHPGMYQGLADAAAALEMKTGTNAHGRSSGTDAFGLQVAREGIPTGLVSIPLRYMHTMVESLDMSDVERCGRLLGEFIARLDDHFVDGLVKRLLDGASGTARSG